MKYAAFFMYNKSSGEVFDKILFSYKELKQRGYSHRGFLGRIKSHFFIFKKPKVIESNTDYIQKLFLKNASFQIESFGNDYTEKKNEIIINDVPYKTDLLNWCAGRCGLKIILFDTEKDGNKKFDTFMLMYELGLI